MASSTTLRGGQTTNCRSRLELSRELEILQKALLPRLKGLIKNSLPHPSLSEVRNYLLEEWAAAYPVRAFLTKLAYCCGGGKFNDIRDIATAIELAQLASLVVDDVIDRADIRDGPSAYDRFGQDVSILVGDVLKGTASVCLIDQIQRNRHLADGTNALRQFEALYSGVCVGQLMDLWYEKRECVGLRAYLKMIHLTTAGFLEGAALIGATLAGAAENLTLVFRQYASSLGMAFQIYDDVLDLVPRTSPCKPFAHDIRRRKKRLPLLKYLERCTPLERQTALHLLRAPNISATKVDFLVSEITRSGALARAIRHGKRFSVDATKKAMLLPVGPCRRLSLALVDFIQPENDEGVSNKWQTWLAAAGENITRT